MKKIIWISSYPKSGNTWVRYLLANYFFNINQQERPDIIDHIPRFRTGKGLQLLTKVKKKISLEDISRYWIKEQQKIKFENGKSAFIKNHNANVVVSGNHFTNEQLTLAVLYIVRDPRDVVVSASSFFGYSYDNIIKDFILNDHCIINNNNDFEFISSWKINYLSWKHSLKAIPKLFIRYEDLYNNCHETFLGILKFLSSVIPFEVDIKQLQFSIDQSMFSKLQDIEMKGNFKENTSVSEKPFFRKGQTGQFKNQLSLKQIKLIEDCLKNEMIELNYI